MLKEKFLMSSFTAKDQETADDA